MKIIYAATLILTTLAMQSCSTIVKSIKHHNNLKDITEKYAFKYRGQCQKEAFQYYPVAIVTNTTTRQNIIQPTKTATCTSIGNTINCTDTTIDLSGLTGAGKTTTTSYDANLGARNNHINSCVKTALKGDESFVSAVSNEKRRYNNSQNK